MVLGLWFPSDFSLGPSTAPQGCIQSRGRLNLQPSLYSQTAGATEPAKLPASSQPGLAPGPQEPACSLRLEKGAIYQREPPLAHPDEDGHFFRKPIKFRIYKNA